MDGKEAGGRSLPRDKSAKPTRNTKTQQDREDRNCPYGAALAGVPQPESNLASGTQKAGWREWFSDYAADEAVIGAVALHTGPYVYEFTALTSVTPPDSEYYLASDRGVESATVHRDWKDNPIWYQSAVRRDES